ncbi:MAG: M15 family metallopeptidase [Bdellovibrionota bacterium]
MNSIVLLISLTATPALADNKTASFNSSPSCKIGTGQVAIPSGDQMGFNLLTPVSKRELLAGTFAPSNLVDIPWEYISPEQLAKIKPVNQPEMMRSDALRSLEIMLDEARRSGVEILVHSAYRSFGTQCLVFNNKLKIERSSLPHLHESDAIGSVNKRSAFPGQSEHQLGAVVDLVTNIPGLGYKLEWQLDTTPAYAWLKANAHQYGYVLSYPRGAQTMSDPHPQTGYIYEPWHWRYIGEQDAQNYNRCLKRMSMIIQDYMRVKKQDKNFYCS